MLEQCLAKASEEMLLRNYSRKTISAYLGCIKEFLSLNEECHDKYLEEHVRHYLLFEHEKGYAPQTVNLHLNAINFYYRRVLRTNARMEAKFAKRSKKLPSVLTRDEIASLLANVKNIKHRTLIALAYGAGLRVSEVVRLKVVDVQLDGPTLHLKQTKGAKDRITVSLEKLLGDLCVLIPVKQGMIMSF